MDVKDVQPVINTTSQTQKTTLIILVFLLAGRIFESCALLLWHALYLPYWWEVTYLVIAYFLISITFFINRRHLRSLNLDKNFMVLFIFIGFIYALSIPLAVGIVIGLLALFNLRALWTGWYQFEPFHPNYLQLFALILLYFVPDGLLFVLTGRYPILQNSDLVLRAVFTANPPLVIFEEVMFRGMLWMVLKNFNLKDLSIVGIQSVAFWIVHINYIFSKPLFFWLLVPISSIVFGLIVLRAKSLTFSWVIHFLDNLLAALPY